MSGAESLAYAAVRTHDGPNTIGEGYFLRVPADEVGSIESRRLVGDDNSDSGEQVRQFLALTAPTVVRRGPSSDGTMYYWMPENSLQGGNSVDDYHYRAQQDARAELNIEAAAIKGQAAVATSGDYNDLENRPNLQDGRTLFRGPIPTGLRITSLDAPSATARFNLQEALNLVTEPHGVLLNLLTPTLSGFAASDIAFTAAEYDDETTLDSVGRAAVYDGANALGRVVVTADLLKGSTLAGSVVVRSARDATGDVADNWQYLPHQGHSLKDSGNVAADFEQILLSSGAPRSPGSGQAFVFETLPDAGDLLDGDRVWVTGSVGQGGYVKESAETHVAADTGLAGLTLNPSTDLVSTDDGVYDVDRFNRSTFVGPGGGTIAVDTSGWSAAPAALDYVYLSYRSSTRDNGSLVLKYSSARSYAGPIVIRAGDHLIRIAANNPPNPDEWREDGLSLATVAALRENNWTFSEPGMTGYAVTHSLRKVLAGVGDIPEAPSGGGTASRMTSEAVTVTTATASVASTGVWGDFVTVASINIADSDVFDLSVQDTPDFSRDPSGGGDRVVLWWRVVRERSGQADVTLGEAHEYPRYLSNFGTDTDDYEWPSIRRFICDDQQSGDTIRLRVRMMRQADPAVTVTFSSTNTRLRKIGVG